MIIPLASDRHLALFHAMCPDRSDHNWHILLIVFIITFYPITDTLPVPREADLSPFVAPPQFDRSISPLCVVSAKCYGNKKRNNVFCNPDKVYLVLLGLIFLSVFFQVDIIFSCTSWVFS